MLLGRADTIYWYELSAVLLPFTLTFNCDITRRCSAYTFSLVPATVMPGRVRAGGGPNGVCSKTTSGGNRNEDGRTGPVEGGCGESRSSCRSRAGSTDCFPPGGGPKLVSNGVVSSGWSIPVALNPLQLALMDTA